MSIVDVTILIAALLNLVLSGTVYLHSRRQLVETLFAVFALSVSLWSLGTFLMTSEAVSFELFRIGAFLHYISGNFVFWALFWFSVYYPSRTIKSLFWPTLLSGINAAILISIVSSPFLFRSFETSAILADRISFNSTGYFILSVVVVSIFALAEVYLVAKYVRAKKEERTQIGMIILATATTGSLGLITNLILPGLGNFSLFYVGPIITSPLFVGLMIYSIIRYKVFSLRVITAEIFTVLLILAQTVDLFLSKSRVEIATRSFILVVLGMFGYFLIRSVYREIEAREEVERLDRIRSEFLSIATHQLRTPLTIIKGYLSNIREGVYEPIGEKTRKAVEHMYISNEGLIRLVNELLDMTRIEAGRMQYTFAEFDLNHLVNFAVEEFRIPADDKGVKIVWENRGKPIMVWGDEMKLREVVFNLIDNALKYTEKGNIVVKLEEQGITARVSVKDFGIGMSKETIGRLFQKFSRGASGARVGTEGTGLGLYVAKRIADDHKGELWAESAGEGKGSTFFLKVPSKNPEEASQAPSQEEVSWRKAA
jgi:signal transduction histidine kinase